MKLQREGFGAPASSQTVGRADYARDPDVRSMLPADRRSGPPLLLIGAIIVLLLILAGAAARKLLGWP